MISIVIYGRNDNYGYNQSKRWVLGLNCMAAVLTAPADEIVYVDYNTPEDFPTFPESVADLLTEPAKQRLRILRVRPQHHQAFASRSHLSVLEPVARNVAIRRTNPANRWVLSTNPDMIFVPRLGASLSAIAAELPRAYYAIPRFEVPEMLWESFDRTNPAQVLRALAQWGEDAYLNDAVHGDEAILYGAPGDFQLVERADLFAIDGFDESKLLGWHNDSNLFRRLSLLHDGAITADLADQVHGYHCAHTLQLTPMQAADAPRNDYETTRWATQADLPAQRATWGLADADIEEFSLARTPTHVYLDTLKATLATNGAVDGPESESPGRIDYDARHVLPFVLNVFVNAPRPLSVAWVGTEYEMFRLFEAAWRSMGFEATILVPDEYAWALGDALPPGVAVVDLPTACMRADAVIFDFAQRRDLGWPETQARNQRLLHALDAFCLVERLRLERRTALPRRVVAINAIYNAFDALVLDRVDCVVTPYCSRVRTGFVPGPDREREPALGHDVLTIVPTRSAPDASTAFAEAFQAHSTRSDLLFVLDEDDPRLTEYRGIPGVLYEINPGLGRVGLLNLVTSKYSDQYAYFAFMSDRHRIVTPGWDQKLVETIADVPLGVAYGNDRHGSPWSSVVLLPTAIAEGLGFVAPPALIDNFADWFWRDLGQALDAVRFGEDVVIELAAAEASEPRVADDFDRYTRDLAAYEHYFRSRLRQDIAHLHALNGPPTPEPAIARPASNGWQSLAVAPPATHAPVAPVRSAVTNPAILSGATPGPNGASSSLGLLEEPAARQQAAVGLAELASPVDLELELDPLGTLRRKWDELPVGRGRVHSSQMLAMSDEDLVAMWELAWAADTQGLGFGHRGWYQQLYRDLVTGSRLLDVGCGFALDSLAFAKMGARVTFTDIISDNVAVVKRLCDILGITADFLVIEDLASFNRLPNDFDIVTSLGSLINAPLDFSIKEVTAIKPHLRAGGRWLHFAYPKARWLHEGSNPLWRWGEGTDGPRTPWMEWHDADKVRRLFGDSEIRILFDCEFHQQHFNWFDIELVRH